MFVPETKLIKPAGPGSLEPAADAEHRTIRGFHGGGSNATQVSSSADDGRHLRGERNCRTTSGKGIESGSDGDCGLVQEQDFNQEVNDVKVNNFEDDKVFQVRCKDEACSNGRQRHRSTVAGDSAPCGLKESSGTSTGGCSNFADETWCCRPEAGSDQEASGK